MTTEFSNIFNKFTRKKHIPNSRCSYRKRPVQMLAVVSACYLSLFTAAQMC